MIRWIALLLLSFHVVAQSATNLVTFAWDDTNSPPTLIGFRLWRDSVSAFTNPVQVATSPTTNVVYAITNSQRYWFAVDALGTNGFASDFSNTNTVSTVPPSAPVITIVNASQAKVDLFWPPVTNYSDGSPLFPGEIVRYQLFRGTTLSSITNAVTQPGIALNATDPSPLSGIMLYVVRASVLTTNIFSQSLSTQVVIFKPAPPKAFRVQSVTIGP